MKKPLTREQELLNLNVKQNDPMRAIAFAEGIGPGPTRVIGGDPWPMTAAEEADPIRKLLDMFAPDITNSLPLQGGLLGKLLGKGSEKAPVALKQFQPLEGDALKVFKDQQVQEYIRRFFSGAK